MSPSKALRRTREYREWRNAVRKESGGKCYICGKKRPQMQAHHIVPMKEDLDKALDITNGKNLCRSCHRLVEGKLPW